MFSVFRKIMKYVWPEMRDRKWIFYGIIFFFAIRVLVYQVVGPVYFKQIIDLFSTNVQGFTKSRELFFLVWSLIVINITGFFVARILKFVIMNFEIKTIQNLRDSSFKKIAQNSMAFFANTFSGSLVTKVRRFTFGFESAFDIFVYNFLEFFVILVGVFTVLFFESKQIGLIFLVWIVVHMSLILFLVGRKFAYDLKEAEQDSRISGRLADVFSNILAVKFFSALKKEITLFNEHTSEGAKRSKKAWFMEGKIDIVQHFIILVVESVVLYSMAVLWLRGEISTGTIVLVQTYMVIIGRNLWEFTRSSTRFMKSVADMKEVVDIFEAVPDILDPTKPEKLTMSKGNIAFNNVYFNYKNGQSVFSNFNLNIQSGERVGLVGHSGAGKSTITSLVLRFLDVEEGSITIDEQDIRAVAQDDLRSVVSYVPQESVLFHRTVLENISYGKSNATKDEVMSAAKKAHAHEFITKLPKGYDTKVGERGVKLSGGERQRVAIARAMLKDAPILIFDEATSSLDSVSESLIQEAFDELMKGKTTIVIAHRLSTIQKMDRIIVLDAGQIVEEGTHKELLGKNGVYANLWNHQTGGFME